MPGIPLTFHPTLNAEARAQAHTIQYPPSTIKNEEGRRRRHAVDICGAAAWSPAHSSCRRFERAEPCKQCGFQQRP